MHKQTDCKICEQFGATTKKALISSALFFLQYCLFSPFVNKYEIASLSQEGRLFAIAHVALRSSQGLPRETGQPPPRVRPSTIDVLLYVALASMINPVLGPVLEVAIAAKLVLEPVLHRALAGVARVPNRMTELTTVAQFFQLCQHPVPACLPPAQVLDCREHLCLEDIAALHHLSMLQDVIRNRLWELLHTLQQAGREQPGSLACWHVSGHLRRCCVSVSIAPASHSAHQKREHAIAHRQGVQSARSSRINGIGMGKWSFTKECCVFSVLS